VARALSLLGKVLRVFVGFALAFAFAGALAGSLCACQRDVVPPLVEVTDVTPREVELGDKIEVRGSGFPQGRSARVTLRGTLHRAGESPVRGVAVEATGAVEGVDRIVLSFGDDLEEKLAGHGERAAHTTFRGELEVAFASSAPGAPPLTGTLRNVTLDVRPSSVGSAIVDARDAEGARLLAFLGIAPGAASARGLPVDGVAPGSPAARAGIEPGDVLVEADGVRVFGASDLVPASARALDVVVRHGAAGLEDARSIPLVGYSASRIPAEYLPAVLLVGLALAWLLLLVMPSPAALAALEIRGASLLRATNARALAASLFGTGRRALVSVLASVLVGTFALGPHVVDADADGAILLVASLALLAASRVTAARGFGASIRAAVGVALAGAGLALALAGAVVLEGAFQLGELVRVQGGAPWELAATRQPAAAVLAFAYAAVLFALVRRTDAPAAPAAPAASAANAANAPGPVGVMDRLGVFVAAALGVAVFLGGWRLPGVVASSPSLALHVLAGAAFVGKTWAAVAALRGAAALATGWASGAEARGFVLKRIVPALALAAALVALTRRFAPAAPFETACGATVATAFVLLAARSLLRVRDAMTRPEPHASPFL
jgi:NADH-quinone oxidoreductase subunit H